jgi:hypothetical protein
VAGVIGKPDVCTRRRIDAQAVVTTCAALNHGA